MGFQRWLRSCIEHLEIAAYVEHLFLGICRLQFIILRSISKNTYEDSWILDDFAKKVIKRVDGSDVIDAQAIKSPVLGIIPPTELSGGVKTLLLIKNCPDEVFNASTCGDNCARFILELAKAKDVTINLRHIMDFDKARFAAKILNDDSIVHNMEELLPIAARYA